MVAKPEYSVTYELGPIHWKGHVSTNQQDFDAKINVPS